MQAQAELGFIVVQIDGMGTSNRSKAFHDVAWRNFGNAGLADRTLWHKAVAAVGCHDNRMDKIWWNEQWMGWPIGPEYAASSNVVNAHKLQGRLLLVVGELDTNVDPSSTLQVVNALIKANKTFDLLVIPGAGHGALSLHPEPERRRRSVAFARA